MQWHHQLVIKVIHLSSPPSPNIRKSWREEEEEKRRKRFHFVVCPKIVQWNECLSKATMKQTCLHTSLEKVHRHIRRPFQTCVIKSEQRTRRWEQPWPCGIYPLCCRRGRTSRPSQISLWELAQNNFFLPAELSRNYQALLLFEQKKKEADISSVSIKLFCFGLCL